MDIIITTNDRPYRLLTTLTSLYHQEINEDKHLVIVDNSKKDVTKNRQIIKILLAYKKNEWNVSINKSNIFNNVAKLKQYALTFGCDDKIILLDNDVLFTRNDTIQTLANMLDVYDISCITPLAYDIDNERMVLNKYTYMYDLVKADENGVSEGNKTIGLCMVFYRKDYKEIEYLMCPELTCMEDQIMTHYFKKYRGYAFLKTHFVYHITFNETPTYTIHCRQILNKLKKKLSKIPEYDSFIKIRERWDDDSVFCDGANFNKGIFKNAED